MRRIPPVPLRVLFLCLLSVILTASAGPPSVGAADRQQKYDDYFRKYTKQYFGRENDWKLFKAQAIVESNLRPDVVSGEGAVGLMQIEPKTYAAMRRQNRELGDIKDPQWNIAAGILYDHQQWELWKPKSDSSYHQHFMLGSYNAGSRPLRRAQELAQAKKMNHKQWPTIEKVAPLVEKWKYKETLPYVKSVFINYGSLDKNGRVVGETISKVDDAGRVVGDVGKRLGEKVGSALKKFPHILDTFWKPFWKHDD